MAKHLSETRTETLILDLLNIQGWATGRPPHGSTVRQNEYKSFLELEEIFKGKSKRGKGDAYPDFLLISRSTHRPQMVVEAKSDVNDLNEAIADAIHYSEACMEAGHSVIAVGVAGQEKTKIDIGVLKNVQGEWKRVIYAGNLISWIPTPQDVISLLSSPTLLDLAPVVPRPEVLADKADLINRLLREAHVKDEYRAAYVGAMMLALWQSRGSLRKDPDFVLRDINSACEDAYTKGGKPELAKSLHIDEANSRLAASTWQILATLEKLNVVTASFAHDYLGQLYEAFFRYTGGNTIGQYFTPRHITRFMADICEVTQDDIVIDPACGTGGFLIACLQRVCETPGLRYEDAVRVVQNNLIGYESEPITAALCVANMILRGDGKTGIRKADCFSTDDYPVGKCQVALMNPPFPHRKTDVPPQKFIERALEALEQRGKLAVILPTSLIVKPETGEWRSDVLSRHSLLAVCELPDELFQPYASSTTSIVVFEKGIPHNARRETIFTRLQYDGFALRKGTRVPRLDGKNQLSEAVDAILNKRNLPGFSGVAALPGDAEWAPGAYIPSALPTEEELKVSIDELLRRLASFYARYAPQVAAQRSGLKSGELNAQHYRELVGSTRLKNAQSIPCEPDTIGYFFDIFYGQKELHSREGIPPGESLIISPTEEFNGCYGWLSFEHLIQPPFVTVAQTGSIGEAFVQLEPCGVNDDCLLLLPKEGTDLPLSCMFIAAALIRLERWRFNYGRKLTPLRICNFRMSRMPELEKWVDEQLERWKSITENTISLYSA